MVFDELCVLANGDVVCSCGDPAGLRVYGNVHRDRLAEIYDGPRYREIRRWQLESRPDAWCPVIGTACGGRVARATSLDEVGGRVVRVLQLEPVSACNLRCPACPATQIGAREPTYAPDRLGILPLPVMLDVVDQLPWLEKLLFYNFGEPFLHPQAVDFLRTVRGRRPRLVIHTSTNGLALDAATIEAVVAERLLDRIVVSIDGAFPESYTQYRRGGRLEPALAALRQLVAAQRRHGAVATPSDRPLPEVLWQYILFEWNDGDDELAHARQLAADIGVAIQWVVTHTAGASRRFLPGSPALAALVEGDPLRAFTCDLRVQLQEEGRSGFSRYAARVRTAETRLQVGRAGGRLLLPVELANLGDADWTGRSLRLGVARLDEPGAELAGTPVWDPPAPGCSQTVLLDLPIPAGETPLRLLVDVVEEGVCWFSERGATPLGLLIERVAPASAVSTWSQLLASAYAGVAGHPPAHGDTLYWTDALGAGWSFEYLLEALTVADDAGEAAARRERSRVVRRQLLDGAALMVEVVATPA